MGKPHLNIGAIGHTTVPSPAALSMVTSLGELPAGDTTFCKLSKEAQGFIIGAIMGDYDAGPPEIPPDVELAIARWIEEPE